LVTEEGYLHPSASAFSAMAWRLEGTRFARRVEVAEAVHAYIFSGDGRSVAVVAPHPARQATYALPAVPGGAWADLSGNPLKAGTQIGRRPVYLTVEGGVEAVERGLGAR